VIPAKRGKKTWWCTECAPRCDVPSRNEFTARPRLIESLFSSVNANFRPVTGSPCRTQNAPSFLARIEFQSVSVETSPPFPEDVNRAKPSHKGSDTWKGRHLQDEPLKPSQIITFRPIPLQPVCGFPATKTIYEIV